MDESLHGVMRGLLDKYGAIARLRASAGAQSEAEARSDMLALASRFPGALRELDRLPDALLEERLSALRGVVEHGAPPARWMLLQASYHGYMRAALRLRRALRERAGASLMRVDLAMLSYVGAADEPERAWFDEVTLRAIEKPPAGRLNPWVFAEVAKRHGTTAAEVTRALFSD